MTKFNNTSSAESAPGKDFIATLPFRSQQVDDPDANYDVSIWRSPENLCEWQDPAKCDTASGIYYGSAEDDATKFCPRHYYEMHFGADAGYRLVDPKEPSGPTTSKALLVKKTFCIWADDVRRVCQYVEAYSPRQAHEIAGQQPESWKFCDGHDDNGYRLSDEVQDLETDEFVNINDAKNCKACGAEKDSWSFGMPLEEALNHRLAEVRNKAELKSKFDQYCSLRLEDKIRLAMDILWDVNEKWNHDTLVSYPENMPSFDEYLDEIGSNFYDIEWK